MNIPLVDLKAQYLNIKPEVNLNMNRVLENASFILGEEVSAFETEFADYVQAAGAVGVASGTAAVHLALLACEIGPGDEVITAAHTFFATAEAISLCGAIPVFADIDEQTYTLDPEKVEAAITPCTKAIVAVHLYGQPANMDSLVDISNRHDLRLIEDAAQAHGSEFGGKRIGSIGDLACFSFYPGKNLGAYGDAGAVTGNDTELLARVSSLRNHGRTAKYEHDEIGFGERMDGLQGAVLRAKLPHLEEWTECRRKHALKYDELLADVDIVTPYASPNARHVYHLYVIRTAQRDSVLASLKSKGIGASIHYPIPLHRQPAYLKLGYASTTLPITERVADEILSLPIYPELTSEQIAYIADVLKEIIDR